MSSCISDKLCLRFILFCFLIKLYSCLPLTVNSSFLFKRKSKKRDESEEEIVDLSLFLSSFSAFLYKTAAMSEQYFNQNEPKAH